MSVEAGDPDCVIYVVDARTPTVTENYADIIKQAKQFIVLINKM